MPMAKSKIIEIDEEQMADPNSSSDNNSSSDDGDDRIITKTLTRRRPSKSPKSEHNLCPNRYHRRSLATNTSAANHCCSAISSCHCPVSNNISADAKRRLRRRRRRPNRLNSSSQRGAVPTMVTTTALLVLIILSTATTTTMIANSDGPFSLFASAFSFSSPPPLSPAANSNRRQLLLRLHAVRKRVGSHHHNQPSRITTSTTPNSSTNINIGGRRRKNNVFEQFTPEYIASPNDVDVSGGATTVLDNNNKNGRHHADYSSSHDNSRNKKHKWRGGGGGLQHSKSSITTSSSNATSIIATTAAVNNNNANNIKNANKINLRLRSLLLNDEGEINPSLPDDSPEAAQQLALFHTYSKLSDEARRKAKESVSSHHVDDDDYDDDEGGEVVATTISIRNLHKQEKRTTTTKKKSILIRATVKETGSDSISSYTKSLGQHELLHKDDEVLLGRQVRMLMILEERRMELEKKLLRPPTFAQWAASTNHTVPSLKQQIRRSQRAKAALIEANLRLVITVARQAVKKSPYQSKSENNSIQFQDACQQGIIGLTRATEKFDPELGFRFSTYAIWWIQKEVTKNVSEQTRVVRVPPNAIKKINDIRIQERVLMAELGRRPNDDEVAEKVGMSIEKLNFYRQSAKGVSSLDKTIDARKGKGSNSSGGSGGDGQTMDMFVKDTEQPSPSELIDQQMLKDDIRRLVKTLSPREQAVIRLRFGLDDGKPQSLGDISAKFGVEKEKVKKIEARALLKLRQPSRSQVVRCYVSDHT